MSVMSMCQELLDWPLVTTRILQYQPGTWVHKKINQFTCIIRGGQNVVDTNTISLPFK